MGTVLSLFPARIAFVKPDGTLTPEAYRALQTLLVRVGGPTGPSMDDGALLAIFAAPVDSAGESLELAGCGSDVAETRKYAAEMDVRYLFAPATTVPWDRPGEVGLRTPNSGAFTTLSAGGGPTAGTVMAPSFYLAADTTTGFYRIGANNWGFGVAGAKLVDLKAALVAITGGLSVSAQITSTAAVGTAPLVVASTTQVPNLYVARATLADAATTLTSPNAYPAAATDLPTVIALANALRAAAVAKGL